MHKFREFLKENNDLQRSIAHKRIEWSPIEGGINGTKVTINLLSRMVAMLSGHGSQSVNIVKFYDEGTSIVAGKHPETGEFFVGTESFESGHNLCYTQDDVQSIFGDSREGKIFSAALRYLPQLSLNGIIRGTVLFISDDIKTQVIDGKSYVTFQPGGSIYAVPSSSDLGKDIVNARIGVVWHYSYVGQHLYDLEISPNVEYATMTKTKDVWSKDGSFIDATGKATFTKAETDKAKAILQELGTIFASVSPRIMNILATTGVYRKHLLNYMKTHSILEIDKNPSAYVERMIKEIELSFNTTLIDTKHADAKLRRISEKTVTVTFFTRNKAEFIKILKMFRLIMTLKNMILFKITEAESDGILISKSDGLHVSNEDGYLAFDTDGNIVKLTNKLSL